MCAKASPSSTGWASVRLGHGFFRHFFYYGDDKVLAFDYWLGAKAPAFQLQTWNNGRLRNFEVHFDDSQLARERWTHLEIPLAKFSSIPRGIPPEAGDPLLDIQFIAGKNETNPLYIDNVEIFSRRDR
jgi:hypothetical protein